MGYWTLAKRHPQSIGFGFLNAFFSGLGQTHFISLFGPLIMGAYSLNNTEYGSLYSGVTLLSGILISVVGPMIDRYDLRFFGVFIGIGLIASQYCLINGDSLWLMTIGLFGLRFFGQGLCSSVSGISIARHFHTQRGKALSLSQLGFPFYEGLITPLTAYTLQFTSYQTIGFALMAAVGFLYIPSMALMTRSLPLFNKIPYESHDSVKQSESQHPSWTRKQVFSDKTIYLLMPQTLMPPFALTGLLFHQAAIADLKGWTLGLMAGGFVFFAIGRVANSFVTGPLVDKYGATTLFPYYQIPLNIGFVGLAVLNPVWTPSVCFLLFGLTVGSGGPIKSAIWAELYGVRHLGALKSAFATIMVLSTAISPALFGFVIDRQQSSFGLLIALAIVGLAAQLLAIIALKQFNAKSCRPT